MGLKSFLKNQKKVMNLVTRFRHLRYVNRDLRWFKTLYINLKTQKFSSAIKFPIFIYGDIRFATLKGKIFIDAPIKKGMIRIGQNSDKFSSSKGSAMITLYGSLIFKGEAVFSVDCSLEVIGKLEIGDLVVLGNGVRIRCWDHIIIGDGSRVTVECQIYDTNFHYTRNLETGRIYRKNKPIIIGQFCWIGNRSTIMKGTKLSDYTIVASNSLCNKDYTTEEIVAPLIAGQPGKIISAGNVRVLSDESIIDTFFANNPDAPYFQGVKGVIDESEYNRKAF